MEKEQEKVKEYCNSILNKPFVNPMVGAINILKDYQIYAVEDGYELEMKVVKLSKDSDEEEKNRVWEFGLLNSLKCPGTDGDDIIGKLKNVFVLPIDDDQLDMGVQELAFELAETFPMLNDDTPPCTVCR